MLGTSVTASELPTTNHVNSPPTPRNEIVAKEKCHFSHTWSPGRPIKSVYNLTPAKKFDASTSLDLSFLDRKRT